ncbi:MAG: hypothetical protein JWM85_1083, partial [Acidimicrobiaceae bacterium]|nr:hypothetical protein [Acidimicrobiaceae bacterium]
IAHALAGVDAGHRSRWKELAQSLGARPERCYDTASVRHPIGYVGRCPSCAATISRARRYLVACKACCDRFNDGKFSATYRIVWGDEPGRDPWISPAFGGS